MLAFFVDRVCLRLGFFIGTWRWWPDSSGVGLDSPCLRVSYELVASENLAS